MSIINTFLIHQSTKDNMLSIQPRSFSYSNKELTSIGASSSIGHGQTILFMLQGKVFIIEEFGAMIGMTASSIFV
jgi:hypothetical protein